MTKSGLPSATHVVIVLNWNGHKDTLTCIESLATQDPPVTVLVVDNGSFDGTLEAVHLRWPQVSTLQTGENLGFAGGMNAGLTWAQARGANVITVLNNDTVVSTSAMRTLEAAARNGMVAVSPEVRYLNEPDRVWFGGGTLSPPQYFPHHTPTDRLARAVDGERDVDVLSGCCVSATAEVWEAVGGFNEAYFLNFEDSEWSLRARDIGVRLAVRTDAVIHHAVSASFTGAAANLGTYYYTRNGLMFNRAAGGGRRSRIGFVFRVAREALARAKRSGQWRSGSRELRMIGAGTVDYLRGREGRAREALQQRTSRWAND